MKRQTTALELIVSGRLSDARVMLSGEQVEQKYRWIFEHTNLDKLPDDITPWDYYFHLRNQERKEMDRLKTKL